MIYEINFIKIRMRNEKIFKNLEQNMYCKDQNANKNINFKISNLKF